ncbi:MAG: hypothetical protein J0L92_00760 [Deltaproteobacteria bacterium]|nr:hypothetical protein [Deltaproteobacteria bacterium]
MPSLPDRPLVLDRRFVLAHATATAIPFLVLATLGGAALALSAEDLARLSMQDAIRRDGVRAEHARVDIERDVSLFVFRARRYEVAFEDAHGEAHRARVREHDVSIAPLVVTGPPDVRYDARDPSRISVGFAHQNVRAQHAAVALLAAVGVAFLALAGWALARVSRGLRHARDASRRLDAASGTVVSMERSFDSRGEPTGELRLVLALERRVRESHDTYRSHDASSEARVIDARSPRLDLVTPAHDPPIFLDPSGTRVLLATTARGEPVLVRRSGHPFVLTDEERDALTAGSFGPPSTR